MKNRIQFYHYYVLRILCPISLYTFLNKQISNNIPTIVSKIIFSLNYLIMEKEPVRVSSAYPGGCKRSARTQWVYSKNSQISLFWANFYLISSFSTPYHSGSMKSYIRQWVLTLFLCNGTRKHREPHSEREYHLKSLFFSPLKKKTKKQHIIILNLNDKIMEKEPAL